MGVQVDKIDLFREVERLAVANDLDADEIRLYLLLLANCQGPQHGRIEYATIKNAIGGKFSPQKLERACQHLFASSLVVVTSGFPEDMAEKDFVLDYLILPKREL